MFTENEVWARATQKVNQIRGYGHDIILYIQLVSV